MDNRAPGAEGRPRLLVIGNGMATERLLEELAARGGPDRLAVTVLGEEAYGAYNRILLSHVLGGASPDDIVTKPPDWYTAQGIELVTGRFVHHLDTAARTADIGNGERLDYDLAVFATGASAFVPPVTGARQENGSLAPGVHVLRTLDDCLRLRADSDPRDGRRDAVVVGGGLLGLEAAASLLELGHRVTVLHLVETLLDAQVDPAGGGFVRRAVEGLGIEVVVGRTERILVGDRAEALLLDDGRVLPADVVVFSTGVRPRIDAAVASRIEVERGIVIDDTLATSAPDVYAIGDCAEHRGLVPGLVAVGWDQAAVLAARLSGADPGARYRPTPIYTRLKVAGVEVASIGAVREDEDDEVLQVIEKRRGVYRKLVVRDGRLAGAVLVGDAHHGATLARMFERGEPVPAQPADLFCSLEAFRGGAGVASDLCHCNRVSEAAVVEAIVAGHDRLDLVRSATRAGTGCGSCVGSIEALLARLAPAELVQSA